MLRIVAPATVYHFRCQWTAIFSKILVHHCESDYNLIFLPRCTTCRECMTVMADTSALLLIYASTIGSLI